MSCGVASKAYLDKLNKRAACIIEGRGIGAEELKSTLAIGWSRLKARRNYLKCVLVHKCLHGIAPSYLLSEFRHVHLFCAYNTRTGAPNDNLRKNICSEDDLRSRIFETFAVKCLARLPPL